MGEIGTFSNYSVQISCKILRLTEVAVCFGVVFCLDEDCIPGWGKQSSAPAAIGVFAINGEGSCFCSTATGLLGRRALGAKKRLTEVAPPKKSDMEERSNYFHFYATRILAVRDLFLAWKLGPVRFGQVDGRVLDPEHHG